MKCVADIHYFVVRHRADWQRWYHEEEPAGDIKWLACAFCDFIVKKGTQPRTSTSGLGRYNRMRGRMVKHLHEVHRDRLAEEAS